MQESESRIKTYATLFVVYCDCLSASGFLLVPDSRIPYPCISDFDSLLNSGF